MNLEEYDRLVAAGKWDHLDTCKLCQEVISKCRCRPELLASKAKDVK
jgi:hypothetical protein